jgi:hypothetical protein
MSMVQDLDEGLLGDVASGDDQQPVHLILGAGRPLRVDERLPMGGVDELRQVVQGHAHLYQAVLQVDLLLQRLYGPVGLLLGNMLGRRATSRS